MRINHRETVAQTRQNFIRQCPDHPQRMVLRHTLLQTHKTEKLATRTGPTTHTIAPLGEWNQSMLGKASVLQRPAKATMAYSRLAKRLRALQLSSFAEYCDLVAGPGAATERPHMIQALTTNLTHFFREPHHFEHLKQTMVPALIAQARQGRRVRLWSAGCSSGQEPYSIALTLLCVMPDAPQHDIKILATDIDRNMLAVGHAGIYEADILAPVPPPLLQRFFTSVPGSPSSMRASDELRDLIAFRPLNLIADWPMQGKFDVIFCRNVVIYFSAATQATFWSRLVPRVAPQGALYIGHSERIVGPAEGALRGDGVTVYRNFSQAGAIS
jgi:chemotaxis protein methyltransferase CheR